MAVSSTALVMQMLQDKGEIASPHGSAAFGVLLMQDLAIVPMLALIPMLAGPENILGEHARMEAPWDHSWAFFFWYGDLVSTLCLLSWNDWRARKTGRVFFW